jgi:rare lipoprotein A
MAKRGESTRGIEVAVNQGRMPGGPPAPGTTYQTASYDAGGRTQTAAPVTSEQLAAPPIPGHTTLDGRFMPDPVVTQMAVTPTRIFVQAGSFTVYENAQRLKDSLSVLGPTTIEEAIVNGQRFYRVRAGPAPNVPQADRLLAQVVGMGHHNAIIIVD